MESRILLLARGGWNYLLRIVSGNMEFFSNDMNRMCYVIEANPKSIFFGNSKHVIETFEMKS